MFRALQNFGLLNDLVRLLAAGALSFLCGGVLLQAQAEAKAPLELELTFPLIGADPNEPLPAEAAASLSALSGLEDLSLVLLRAEMGLSEEQPVSVTMADGERRSLTSCDFGELAGVAEVDLPAADNHLIASLSVGSPEAYPANLVYCEYDPNALDESGAPVKLTVRGCYIAMLFSIPTAVHVMLRPAPATACALHP